MDTTAAKPSVLPWDTSVGNRFAHLSAEDHGATLWVAAALALTYISCVLIIRVFVKWRVFGWDDSFIVISTVLAFLQSMVVFIALSHGLGKVSELVADLELVGKLTFSSRILSIASHYLAKLSVMLLIRRLFVRDQKDISLLCDTTIGLTSLSGFGSMLVTTVQCPMSSFFHEHCGSQIARWSLATVLDLITEGMMLVLPSYMVWQVQMKVEKKLRVIAAFCFRFMVIALSASHLTEWISYSNGLPSPFAIVPTLILQQTLLAVSLISATIPNLKSFMQSLSASWGNAGFGSGHTTKAYSNGTFEMNHLSFTVPIASRAEVGGLYPNKGHLDFDAQVLAPRRNVDERSSLGSGGSQELIIRKEMAWTVERA